MLMTLEEKVNQLNERVSLLEKEMATLRGEAYVAKQDEEPVMSEEHVAQKEDIVQEPQQLEQVETLELCHEQPVAKPQSLHEENNGKVDIKEDGDMHLEKKIGTRLLPLVASALIFFAIILFSKIIHPHLNDTAKACIMGVASLATAVWGLMKMGKSNYPRLFAAIAGVGVGACFVTLIVSNMVLGVIGEMPLMIGVLLWILIVILLSRLKSRMFSYICFIGILISTSMCAMRWEDSFIALLVYLACMLGLYVATYTRDYEKDCWMFAQMPVVYCLFWNVPICEVVCKYTMLGTLLIAIVYQLVMYNRDKKRNMLFCVSAASFFVYVVSLVKLSEIYAGEGCVEAGYSYLVTTAAMCYFVYRQYYKLERRFFIAIYWMSILFLTDLMFGYYNEEGCLLRAPEIVTSLLLVLVPFVCGILTNNRSIRYPGYVFLPRLFGLYNPLSNVEIFLVICAIVALMMIWAVWKKMYQDRIILTCFVIVTLFSARFYGVLDIVSCYVLAALVSVFVHRCERFFVADISKVSSGNIRLFTCVYNAFLLLLGGVLIMYHEGPFMWGSTIANSQEVSLGVLILTVCGLACLNIKRLYTTAMSSISVLYTCLKLTVLLYVILQRCVDISYVTSLCGIVVAVVAVVMGVKYNQRVARLYGLGLSMLCIVKLLFFDIVIDNDFYRPISILLSGIFLLVISAIYIRLDKKQQDADKKVQ